MNHRHLVYDMEQSYVMLSMKLCNLAFLLGFMISATMII